MRAVALLLLTLALLAGLPAAAQDLLSGDSKSESATDVLQRLLLGKVKESATSTSAGTKSATPGTAERLPRKAPAAGKAGAAAKDAAQEDQAAKPARAARPPPSREADFHPLPRLKPTPSISGSSTIEPIKPIPMPADPSP